MRWFFRRKPKPPPPPQPIEEPWQEWEHHLLEGMLVQLLELMDSGQRLEISLVYIEVTFRVLQRFRQLIQHRYDVRRSYATHESCGGLHSGILQIYRKHVSLLSSS